MLRSKRPLRQFIIIGLNPGLIALFLLAMYHRNDLAQNLLVFIGLFAVWSCIIVWNLIILPLASHKGKQEIADTNGRSKWSKPD